jgi:hypothetical protein
MNQSGQTLLIVLIASILGMFIAYYASVQMVSGHRAEARMHAQSDLLDLRQHIEAQLDCANTIALAPVCGVPNTFVELRNHQNNTLIVNATALPTSEFGNRGYRVRALCLTCNGVDRCTDGGAFVIQCAPATVGCNSAKRLLVQVALLDDAGNPHDPIHRNQDGWRDLMGDVPVACFVP